MSRMVDRAGNVIDPDEAGGVALTVEPLVLAAAGLVGGMLAAAVLAGVGWVVVGRGTRRLERRAGFGERR